MTPLPVPIQRRLHDAIRELIRTNVKPNVLTPTCMTQTNSVSLQRKSEQHKFATKTTLYTFQCMSFFSSSAQQMHYANWFLIRLNRLILLPVVYQFNHLMYLLFNLYI